MEMIIAGTMLGASLIILLLSVLVMLLTRKNLVEYTAKLTRSLDAMISGTGEIAFEEEKETLVGRIQVKMRQLYEIMKSQNEKGQNPVEGFRPESGNHRGFGGLRERGTF